MGLDPVCKMEVNPVSAEAQSEYGGQVFYFCSKACKGKFDADRPGISTRPTARRRGSSGPTSCRA